MEKFSLKPNCKPSVTRQAYSSLIIMESNFFLKILLIVIALELLESLLRPLLSFGTGIIVDNNNPDGATPCVNIHAYNKEINVKSQGTVNKMVRQ